MGCVSSKALTKSGSFQESVGHSFQRSSNVIEEIILSSSKSNGDQFLALLCKSSSTDRKATEPELSSTTAEVPGKIETINVSELLAGLEEESCAAEQEKPKEEQGDRKEGDRSPAQCASGRSGGSSERAPAPDEKKEDEPCGATEASTSSHGATGEAAESSSAGQDQEKQAGKGEDAAGAKRRARARQLGELNVPTTFDFSKSGSLRGWLLRGGQIFSPGSYVTPKFGTAPALPAAELAGGVEKKTGEKPQHAVFDPELVAQFERAMEQLSEEEERVLTDILDALQLETSEKEAVALGKVSDRPVARETGLADGEADVMVS
ncbi:hypothetical protein PR202_ga21380 [Eleusine coracana subsp. coracana]|uniref:Uncharacterized protein n=1 Tax=Eleusine coracana subsp. coracana TaxID=191504 RepID=A0AAV5CZI0_ELECO|nr:hypothetical protein PR202_ga21380 [Eleusine coracana subsp. coracana]